MSHSSSLLIQSAAGLESLGHVTWKLLSQLCVDVALKTNFTLDCVERKICGRCVNCIAVFVLSKIQRGVVL